MTKVRAEDFASALVKALKDYTSEIEEDLEELKEDNATQAVKELKASGPRDTGDYNKGWTKTKEGAGWYVHNRTNYQLTHLLEKGHARRDGGRVPPKVHIAPIEEKYVRTFEDGIIKRFQK